ncbi:Fc receptor-like protein 2 [Cetorhinus maximus]
MKSLCLLLILVPMTHHWIIGGVTLNVDRSSVYEGDNLHLECQYLNIFSKEVVTFYKDKIPITTGVRANLGQRLRIKVHSSKESGFYQCTADKEESNIVYVTVQELFSTPTLRAEPATDVFEGQRLKVACRVARSAGDIGLQYSFYRDGTPLDFHASSVGERTGVASLQVSGSYHCEADAPRRAVLKRSAGVHIAVKQAFSKPTLKVELGARSLTGQQLKLTCVVQIFRPSLSLRYTFSKDSQALDAAPRESSYVLEGARTNDSGVYNCEAKAVDSKVKKLSNQVLVTLRRIPVSKPELIVQPGDKLTEGDTASITCSVSNGSSPITYTFHKNFNKELHSETSNLTRITYGISKVNESSEGNYSCSVTNDGTKPFLQSNVVTVAVVAHSYTLAKATTALPLLLISAAIVALAFVKLRKKSRGNSADVCTSQGEGTGDRPRPSREETSASDVGHPAARSNQSDADTETDANVFYSVIAVTTSTNAADTETDANVFYSVIAVTNSTNAGIGGDASRWDQPKQEGQADYSVSYAALRHGKNGGDLPRDQLDEGRIYENLPRN